MHLSGVDMGMSPALLRLHSARFRWRRHGLPAIPLDELADLANREAQTIPPAE